MAIDCPNTMPAKSSFGYELLERFRSLAKSVDRLKSSNLPEPKTAAEQGRSAL